MTDTDVAAVLADLLVASWDELPVSLHGWRHRMAAYALAALAEAGYAVVALPEGVAVAHGARLVASPIVEWGTWEDCDLYAIEDTP